MDRKTIDLICCPKCKNPLVFYKNSSGSAADEETLFCEKCKRIYPLKNGIPFFLNEDEIFRFSRRAELVRSVYLAVYTPITNLMFLPCGGVNKARHEVLDRLDIPGNAKILETGIGTGDNLPFLRELRADCCLYGIDNQSRVLNKCLKNLTNWKMNADLFLSNAESLPFRDNTFDVVFHLGAMNIFADRKSAIDEMIRVAKPGTKIVIADESDKANKYYSIFLGKQEKVVPPVDLIPSGMLDIRLDVIWRGFGYALDFRTPRT